MKQKKILSEKIKLGFDKKKCVIGIILAVLSAISCMYFGGSIKAIVIFAVGFIFWGSACIKLDRSVEWLVRGILIVSMMYITVFLSQFILNSSLAFESKKFIFLGMCCVGIVILTGYIITVNYRIALVMGSFLVLALSTANYFVYQFRGNELTPTDFQSIRTAVNVVTGYQFKPIIPMVYGWSLFFLIVIMIYSLRTKEMKSKKNKLRRRVLAVAVEFVLILVIGIYGRNIEIEHWEQDGTFVNGYILNFTMQIRESIVRKPANYNTEKIRKYEKKYIGNTSNLNEKKRPTVIAIMDESFADFEVFGSKIKSQKEILPFFNSLKKNTIRGYALSSVFGGNTANSEFEFLTGNTMAFLPQGSIPYQQYIKKPVNSITANFNDLGYRCETTHPYLSAGWARTKVYPFMGFRESSFLDNYPQKKMIREYVSDEEMFEQIVENYKKKEKNIPGFMFGVTMQNHGGYAYEGKNYKKEIKLKDYSKKYPDAEQYFTLIHETDKAYKKLISYFTKVKEPVVILLFGDHFPGLTPEFYEEIQNGKNEGLDEKMLKYKIPFCIWANYDIEEKYVECTSLNFLSNYLLEAAKLPLPEYNKFLKDVQKQIPAINANGYYSKTKKRFLPISEAKGKEAKILNMYAQMQYNALFEKKNKSKMFKIAVNKENNI